MTLIRPFMGGEYQREMLVQLCRSMFRAAPAHSKRTIKEFNEGYIRQLLISAETYVDTYKFWMAHDDEASPPCGFIGLVWHEDILTTDCTCRDLGFFVDNPKEHPGAADLLLEEAILASEQRETPLILSSSTGINPEIYGRYLRKYGFEEVGRSWRRPNSALSATLSSRYGETPLYRRGPDAFRRGR